MPYLAPDEEAWRGHRATLDAHLPFRDFEIARPTPDGGRRYVSVSGSPVSTTGRFVGYRGVGRDITERKVAEAERRAHMWFLESMDRIHRSMQGTDHFQEMVNNVLGEVLDIFQCERAVLSVFGTRSGTAWYKRLAIKLRAGHDHRDGIGIEYVSDEDAHAMRMEVRAAARPVAFVSDPAAAHCPGACALPYAVGAFDIDRGEAGAPGVRPLLLSEYRSMLLCARLDRGRDAAVRGDRAPAWRCIDQAIHPGGSAAARRVPVRGTAPQPHGELGVGPGLATPSYIGPGLSAAAGTESARDFPTLDTVRQSIYPQDRAAWSERFERALRERSELDVEYRSVQPDGTVRHIRTAALPVLDGSGELVEFVGTDIDITEHRAHLWFLESMDRISRAMQGTRDLERMIREVLDAALEIFSCDRAWLLYPCDPSAFVAGRHGAYAAAVPGRLGCGRDCRCRRIMTRCRRRPHAGGALAAGTGHVRAVKPESRRFGVRSEMPVALRPKGDTVSVLPAPVLAGAQLDRRRAAPVPGDRARLADALSGLLAIRLSVTASAASKRRSASRMSGGGSATTGPVAFLSDEASRIFGVEPLDMPQWHGRWLGLIHPDDRAKAAAASEAALRGGPRYDVEYRVVRPDGALRMVHSQGDVTRTSPAIRCASSA